MSILIKGSSNHGNIYIEDNLISEVGGQIVEADRVIDATGNVVVPGLVNCHTHTAMVAMRSYANDLPLFPWLEKIWAIEDNLKEDHVYKFSKLACLEMIRSGTTCINDMYFLSMGLSRAVMETGMRGFISEAYADVFDEEKFQKDKKRVEKAVQDMKDLNCSRIVPTMGPHAIYTTSEEALVWGKEFADKNKLLVHFHLSETEKEVSDCVEKHGKRPVQYLEDMGFLDSNVSLAHAVWMNKDEIDMLAKKGVSVVHNPASNMKLAVNGVMNYSAFKDAGVTVALGTDSAASNDNLDMFEEMKFAALLQKLNGTPTNMPAHEVFHSATRAGADVLGINAGIVDEGALADLLILNLKRPEVTPVYDITATLVYAANGSCVDTTICDGKILMEDRRIEGEEKVIQDAKDSIESLIPGEAIDI